MRVEKIELMRPNEKKKGAKRAKNKLAPSCLKMRNLNKMLPSPRDNIMTAAATAEFK
jgi:hypothetical protein